MTENEVTVMLAEAIDQDREYKSWHVSTKHLMTLVEMVVAQERERILDIIGDNQCECRCAEVVRGQA
jgi:hypothetical protein